MSDTDIQLNVIKAIVDSGPVTFPRAIAYDPSIGWTIIVYREELMAQFSDEDNQIIASWLMYTTKALHRDYNIQCQWVRE